MNTKFAEKVFRVIFIFVFIAGTVWVPGTSAGASLDATSEVSKSILTDETAMFADDFNDGNAIGWLELLWNDVGPWTVADGVYTSSSESGAAESFVHVNDTSWTDYIYTGKFKLNSASEASILFRVQDAGDGYYDSGDYQQVVNHPGLNCVALFYIRNGVASYTGCESYTFDPDAWYTFRVVVRGSLITYSINDVEVKTWDMANQVWGPEYNAFGGIGVKMARPVGGVQFDDILVMPYDAAVPVAIPDSYTTNAGSLLEVAVPGVLANDTDANGDPLTAVKVTDPANGMLTLNTNGSFTYTPNTGFSGDDTFTYQASDGLSNSNTAVVTITVVQSPQLTLEKSASPTTYSQVGDNINYSYLLTNTGTGTLSGPFTVTDNKTTATCPGNVTPASLNGTVLFDHFESGTLAGYTSGTPAYVNGPAGFGQGIDMSSGAWMRYVLPGWYQWSSDYNPTGKSGSVDLWVYPRQYNVGLVNFNWNNTNTPPAGGHILHLEIDSNGKLASGVWSAGYGPTLTPLPAGNATIPLNQWTHVAFTWGADGTRTYVNGVQDAFTPDNFYPAFNSTNYVYIPSWGNSGIGYLDELRITSNSQTNFGTLSLAPTDTTTCTASYTITQSDVDTGSVSNTARAHGFFGTTPIDSNQDTVTATINPPAPFSLNIRAYIDGGSQLVIRGDTAYWHHIGADAPGRNAAHHDPTYLNGAAWYPDWPDVPDERNRDCNCDSSTFTGLVPALPMNEYYKLNLIQARYNAYISQQPTASNNYTLIVDFDDGPPGGAEWYEVELSVETFEPHPSFSVWLNQNKVDGYGWPRYAPVTLTVEDPSTPVSPDYMWTLNAGPTDWDSSGMSVSFQFQDEFQLKAGQTITLTSGTFTRTHTVTDLVVSSISADTDIVTGTAVSGSDVRIENKWNRNIWRHEVAAQDGSWTADFNTIGDETGEDIADIQPGEEFHVGQSDEDGDGTWWYMPLPNPRIQVRANNNNVEGQEWTLGSTITITVDDPLTPASPDITRTAVVYENPGNPGEYRFDVNLDGVYDIKTGDIVTATDGTTLKATTVTSLAFTDMNMDTDVITGTAAAGSTVDIWACDDPNCYNYDPDPVTDGNGVWSVDFTPIYDITYGTWVDSSQNDEDGDGTFFGQNLPNPRINVRANDNMVEGQEWTLSSTVTITVDDPGTSLSPDITRTAVVYQPDWNPNERRFDINLNGVYDIKPGDIVTASDGVTTKTHTVTSLAFTGINIDTDVVTGTAQAGTRTDVWTCDWSNCYNRHAIADGSGNWSVDFSQPGTEEDEQVIFNVVDGTWVDSGQTDNDNDETMFGLTVSLPTIEVSPGSHWVHARGNWPDRTLISMTIDDPNTPQPVDYSADAVFGQNPNNTGDPNDRLADFDMGNFGLEAGQTITMTGGDITKTYTIQSLEVTGFDVNADTILGTGVSGHQLQVCVNNMPGNCSRHITVGSGGTWTADYHNPGVRSDEQDTTDIHLGSNGWVADYEEDGDQTWMDWTARLGYATVTSINRLDANPTSAASVRFSVSFSKPVTGVDVSDFSLTPIGITGAAITDVTGSQADYTVTVNTGTGTGTLRLNLIDNDSIVDGNGDPLAGLYSYNGSFTTGQTYTILSSGGVLPRTETLYFNGQQWGSVACWNPYSSSCNNSMAIAQQDNARVTVWETPYIYNMLTGESFPLLADGPYTWNPARTELTFAIKAAAKWSDGTPVTAYDVAYTWATNVKYGTNAGTGYRDSIDTIEAVNAQTVLVKAKLGGDGKALNPLMVVSYLSANYVIQKAWTQTLEERAGHDATVLLNDSGEDFIASGPYTKLLADDTKVVLMRNDNYWGQNVSMWGKLPAPKYLAHVIYADNEAGLDALKAGEVDVSQQFNDNVQDLWLVDHLPISTYLPDAPYGIGASLPTAFYNLNSYGLDNVAVRKAIAIAVDYDTIIANAMTNQSPTFTQVPRSLMNPSPYEQALYNHATVASLQWTGNDIAGAKALLDSAGIIDTNGDGWREYNGQKLSYVATCPNGWTDWQAAIELVADAGRAIGIDITTNYPEWSEYQTVVTKSDAPLSAGYDIFMMWSNGAGPANPWMRARNLMSSEWVGIPSNWNGNWGQYSNPNVDALIQAIPGETDPVQLKADYTELTRIYLTDIPSFTLMYRPQAFHTVNESVWTNFPHEGDGTNPPIPPLDLTDGYSIAGLYNLEQWNLAPVAADDDYDVAKNTELNVPAGNGVLANDLDADTLTAIKLTDPASGALIFNPDGSFTYIPDIDYKGTVTFTYQASDGVLTSNIATVTIKVGSGAPPVMPSSFYGEIHISSGSPNMGDVVQAYQPGESLPAATALIGDYQGTLIYSMDVPGETTSEGDVVTFKINGRVVATGVWHSGTNVALNIHPPEAVAGGPYSTGEGTPITFTGSANDWGGDAAVYQWDWNNDGTYDETGATLTHTWDQFGVYTVPLLVLDARQGEGRVTVTVTVTDVLPTNASAGGPYNVTSGQPVTLNGSATCVVVDACTYNWDLNNDGIYNDAIGTSVVKVWYAMGNYPVSLKVTDNDGNAVTASAVVHVTLITHNLALLPGWNLVSFNVHPTDTTIASVLSSIAGKYDLIYAWDATGAHSASGNWLKADNIPMSQDTLTDLNETMGFWIHMNSAGALLVTGEMPTATSISIWDNAGGWNLVGYPSIVDGALPAALSDLGTDFSLVYAYHANATSDPWKLFDRTAPPFVNDLQSLFPGWGYWIKVSADHTWIVTYTP